MVEQCINVADIIKCTNKPNDQQAKFPLNSGLNIQAWEHYLQHYPHRILLQYLKFGFPLSIEDPDTLNITNIVNHISALQYPEAVRQYLDKERAHGAIIGPVDQAKSPHFYCSPLLTRPKDVSKRRVILNLSYPSGNSLNDKVNKSQFDGFQLVLRFPSVDYIVAKILDTPGEVYFSKIDVARAFRNLRVDPDDALKFGIYWQRKYFIDKEVVFGWVHGSSAFQMMSDAVTYIMNIKNHHIWAYIDDYILVGSKEATEAAFHDLSSLLTELGLPMNSDPPPNPLQALTFLGIQIDIAGNTLSIDSDKLKQIYMEYIHASKKTTLSRKAMQSLLGKLLYIHNCVLSARTFINRILDLFRRNYQAKKIHLDSGFYNYIQWFISFLPTFNGVTYLRKVSIPHFDSLHLDASLTRLGDTWSNSVYATPVLGIPGFQLGIVHLEMFNIILAVRLWAKF